MESVMVTPRVAKDAKEKHLYLLFSPQPHCDLPVLFSLLSVASIFCSSIGQIFLVWRTWGHHAGGRAEDLLSNIVLNNGRK